MKNVDQFNDIKVSQDFFNNVRDIGAVLKSTTAENMKEIKEFPLNLSQ